MKQLATFLTLLITANFALADGTIGKVSRIYPHSNDRVYFRLVGDTCKTNKYWYFDFSGEATKAWYAMLLAAASNEAEVTISHPPCDPTQDQAISYVYQDF